MLQSWIESTVDFCIRYSRSVILAGLILAAASAVYAGRHFAINTDINDLLSARLFQISGAADKASQVLDEASKHYKETSPPPDSARLARLVRSLRETMRP